ncbi:PTS system mannose/fructose/N-acetylgalactosamine-transporter subunit IIB [Enterococcus pingfangensis]|uniref:PTS system mannose/fructose/N-acetylgalactosamine-transporter subunit IIB n=1 Tax=Enterococcus pingfangensis TaxID=2559924 RepID=UPI0014851FA3|nr:PTS sugar transporter subunit IIB [Enterococcus pingfangensis]
MIRDLRVDDRLIHGQIALTWPKALGINRIIVANDAASKDKTQQMSLKMALPSDVKALVRSVDDTIAFFENPKAQEANLMVIVGNVVDAEKLAQPLTDLIDRVNLANVGRFDGVPKEEKLALGSAILLNKNEKNALDQLLKIPDLKVVHQIIPDNGVKSIRDMLSDK